jgi:hypothetical protein
VEKVTCVDGQSHEAQCEQSHEHGHQHRGLSPFFLEDFHRAPPNAHGVSLEISMNLSQSLVGCETENVYIEREELALPHLPLCEFPP